MKIIYTIFFASLIAFSLNAQKGSGGYPAGLSKQGFDTEISKFKLSPVNNYQLLEEDAINAANGEKSLRFGLPVPVSISPETHGSWAVVNDLNVWRLMVVSDNAKSINLIFDRYDVPQGGKLFIYNADGSQILGAFTEANENSNGTFSTMPLATDRIIIEYSSPLASTGVLDLHLSYIIHGYRDFWTAAKNFGDSGSCNNNVECPVGEPWSDQIRSSVMLLTANNSRFCSGAAINNTLNDGTPYILTANHCGPSPTDIFMFNYKSPTCTPNQNGFTTDIVQGCIVRASNPESDFCLVELSDDIPSDYAAFFSGWSRQNNPPATATCIHHPAGDVEKISFNTNATGVDVFDNADSWHIFDWEDGTTEGGSSGSALYNENKQIIGQLYGGEASCNNNVNDYFGRLITSWEGGSPSTRLKDWLDPNNSDVASIDGIEASVPQFALNARVLSVDAPSGDYCNSNEVVPVVKIKNRGGDLLNSLVIKYTFENGPIQTYNWTGALATNESETVTLQGIALPYGDNVLFTSWSDLPNGQADQAPLDDTVETNFSNRVGAGYTLRIIADDYPGETSWKLVNTANNAIVSSLLTGSLPDGLSTKDLCLGVGCYKFIIYDTEGDGICCGYGNGSFTLFDPAGAIVESGGTFFDNDTIDFCVSTVLIEGIDATEDFSVFPNPANDRLNVSINSDKAEIELFSGTGQVVKKAIITGSSAVIPTLEFPPGIYFLRIKTSAGVSVRKIVLQR